MTRQELFEGLAKNLLPIIMQDKDIIEVIQKNKFDENEQQLFAYWLVNATISIMLNNYTDEVAQELVETCKNSMSAAEAKFVEAGYSEEIGDALRQILEENIQEWLEIIDQQMAQAKKQMRQEEDADEQGEDLAESEESQEGSAAFAIFKFHTYFLRDAVEHEEDVDEFVEQFPSVDKDVLKTYITFNIFYGYLNKIKNGKIEIQGNHPIAKCLDELIQISGALLEKISNEYIEGVDADEFNNAMMELINDHFNEFIKKMYKRAIKAANSRN